MTVIPCVLVKNRGEFSRGTGIAVEFRDGNGDIRKSSHSLFLNFRRGPSWFINQIVYYIIHGMDPIH
jgi:hypothetical protein